MVRILIGAFVLASLIGCSTTETPAAGDKPAAGKAAPAKAAAPGLKAELAKIKTAIAAAKTGDDFMKVTTDCGKLEIEGAMKGAKVGEDPEFKATCNVLKTVTRAKLAIAESTGGKMSTHCLSASMSLDDLVKEPGPDKPNHEKLAADLKKACGM
ncbi:MAG TPA: hypothetical protein VGQ83_03620 [Polyangia bacterium]|jgi:hypothetical protein